ncbi:hypothetical protein SH601_01710 [Gracilibacillus sp. S3-1-1]|uniref:Uncharacterized protein n=1 Tax=Gracilibacillus pellucidus TaxID=3095368 RepID=A0ACC6M176_9BACI|nr:hypothetical protein [Gracilibacillus sp. S3-1-1]MDX8044689.1 hypothetical protein [Gracilibacillus sp. S3-1-1]
MNNMINKLEEWNNDPKFSSMINLKKSKKIIDKLEQFAEESEIARRYLAEIEEHINSFHLDMVPEDFKGWKQTLSNAKSYLIKEHNCVEEGHYMALYMSVGISFGVLFGLMLDNIALGIPLGLPIGLGVGLALDEKAKKKGLVI